jgi:hypothetical protein
MRVALQVLDDVLDEDAGRRRRRRRTGAHCASATIDAHGCLTDSIDSLATNPAATSGHRSTTVPHALFKAPGGFCFWQPVNPDPVTGAWCATAGPARSLTLTDPNPGPPAPPPVIYTPDLADLPEITEHAKVVLGRRPDPTTDPTDARGTRGP